MSETHSFEEKIFLTLMKDLQILAEIDDPKRVRKESNLLIKRIKSAEKLMGENERLVKLLKMAEALKL